MVHVFTRFFSLVPARTVSIDTSCTLLFCSTAHLQNLYSNKPLVQQRKPVILDTTEDNLQDFAHEKCRTEADGLTD